MILAGLTRALEVVLLRGQDRVRRVKREKPFFRGRGLFLFVLMQTFLRFERIIER